MADADRASSFAEGIKEFMEENGYIQSKFSIVMKQLCSRKTCST